MINKKHILVLLRVSVSIVLLATLVWFCKPAETWNVMRSASIPNLAGALLLYILSMFIVAFRWQILLNVRNIHVGVLRLTKYYIIGFFFNNFLPSSIGGDVSRIINLSSRNVPAAFSFGSVFVERLVGFLAMAFLSICSIFFLMNQFKDSPLVIIITIALAVGFLLLTWICFNPKAEKIISNLMLKLKWKGVGKKMHQGFCAIHEFRHHGGSLWLVFIISIFYQFILGVFSFWVVRAAGLDADFLLIFALMQITSMVGIIPITLETAGTREWIYTLVLVPLGYNKSIIVGAMLLVRILSIAASSLGGIFFLTGDKKLLLKSEYHA